MSSGHLSGHDVLGLSWHSHGVLYGDLWINLRGIFTDEERICTGDAWVTLVVDPGPFAAARGAAPGAFVFLVALPHPSH